MTYTLADIREANRRAGFRFFVEGGARRWHQTRHHGIYLDHVYEGIGGVFFICWTWDAIAPARTYAVFRFDPATSRCWEATTMDGWGRLTDAVTAVKVARRLAAGKWKGGPGEMETQTREETRK